MAKIWIPKSWSGTNPPASGTRVFVGGKGAGKSAYETISVGQTKRCLQSNGKGSVFYGNVSIPRPSDPSNYSDITVPNGLEFQTYSYVKTSNGLGGQYGNVGIEGAFNSGLGQANNMELDYNTRYAFRDALTTIQIGARSGHSWSTFPSDIKNTHKFTFRFDNYWIVYRVTFTQEAERYIQFTIDEYYSSTQPNIDNDNSNQMANWVNTNMQNGTLYLNRNWA